MVNAMEKAGITRNKFIVGLVIAILVSSALSVGISTQLIRYMYALPDYDSGWIDITNNVGEYFNVTHNLNSEDMIVDIKGKTTASDGAHQRYYGLTGNTGWTHTRGGTNYDQACSVVQASDQGYVVAGYTDSCGAGGYDFWLVKTDAYGTLQWNQTYGGTDNEVACSMIKTLDEGYALAGYTASYGAGKYDFWLVKTDSSGNQQWNQTYGGADYDYAYSMVQTSDGGYALAGITNSYGAGDYDFWLVKTDASGALLWSQTYGGTNNNYAHSMVQTSDGGYALAGYAESYTADDPNFWLIKTDSAGNLQWNQTYGGAVYDYAYSVVQTSDGGYALAGMTDSYGIGGYDFWLVKTDSSGNPQWNQTYGGASYEIAYSMVKTSDGGYALAGFTASFGAGKYDFWLVKIDSTGNQQWNQTYGGTEFDYAYSVVQTDDGGYALAGLTNSYGAGYYDFWLVRTDIESGLVWTDSTANTITLYRGATDIQWNYVRVRIWKID
jgi:predicted secreted protein